MALMKSTWQLQEKDDPLNELVDQTLATGPQSILSVNGKVLAVIISVEEYEELRKTDQKDFVGWLRRCPGSELADYMEERSKESAREIDL